MVRVYKGLVTETKAEFETLVKEYKADVKAHAKTEGAAAPVPKHPILKEAAAKGFTWIGMTPEEERDAYAKAQDKEFSDIKKATEGTPNKRYRVFRQSEYPSLVDQISAWNDWGMELINSGTKLPKALEVLVRLQAEIKAKYPKPE